MRREHSELCDRRDLAKFAGKPPDKGNFLTRAEVHARQDCPDHIAGSDTLRDFGALSEIFQHYADTCGNSHMPGNLEELLVISAYSAIVLKPCERSFHNPSPIDGYA